MRKYVLFENVGLLDKMAIYMIGASDKENQADKIGRFGSGFKYALAKVLRTGLDIRIFSGTDEIVIATTPVIVNKKEYHAITIDGMTTSITTRMGPDWKMWQAIREFWCNALDEQQADLRRDVEETLIKGVEYHTRIYLEINEEIETILNYWSTYFADERDDILVNETDIKIYPAFDNKSLYYRKGIRVHEGPRAALYHYDCPKLEINEERVITSEWNAAYYIAKGVSKHATVEVAANILKNAVALKTIENGFAYEDLNENWKTAAESFNHIISHSVSGHYLDKMVSNNYALVSDSLAVALVGIGVKVLGMTPQGNLKEWIESDLTARQSFVLKSALDNMVNDLKLPLEYTVTVVKFNDKDKFVNIDHTSSTILLSETVVNSGKREIIINVLMAQELMKTGSKTELFDVLINKWLTTVEDKEGFFL